MADAFGNPDEGLLVGAHLALNLMIGLSDIPEAAHNSLLATVPTELIHSASSTPSNSGTTQPARQKN